LTLFLLRHTCLRIFFCAAVRLLKGFCDPVGSAELADIAVNAVNGMDVAWGCMASYMVRKTRYWGLKNLRFTI
jgi:hypothetical protein